MALWLAIQVIQIGIFDQLDQACWIFSFTKKIQSFSGRRNVNAKGNETWVPQGSVLSPTFFLMYINDAPLTHGVQLAVFVDDTSLYATDGKKTPARSQLNGGLV
jgi:hypothetical protein